MHDSINYELRWKRNRFGDVKLLKNAARAGKLSFLVNHATISLTESFCAVRIRKEDLI